MNITIYIIIAASLFVIELLYFKIAERYKIIDKPNERSSHSHPTIRGGGIIFMLSAFLFSALDGGAYPWLMLALFLSGLISFIDDIRSMPNFLRFLIHLTSGLLVIYETGLFTLQPLAIAAILVLCIGVINAYNFMDGINGITGFYSLAIVMPLLLTETDSLLKEFDIFLLIGIIVFLFFNARKRARCFAGDVGSVTMAVIVLFLLLTRIRETGDVDYVAFLMLYGVDAVITILQRLYLRENIFKAHRRHLFQLFSNELGRPHLLVSLVYACIQFSLNLYIVLNDLPRFFLLGSILFFGIIYIIIKVGIYKRLIG